MRLGWCGLLITLSSTVLAQHGAELEQFSIQTRKLGQRMEASFKTARRLIDLRDRLFEAKDPDAQLAIVGTYLEVREASVVETRKIIHGLDAVISTAKNTDFVENLADEQVIGTYFDDCDALFGDLQMIEAEARQLATAEVQGPNPYLVAVAEVRKSLADAAELLRKRREGGAMQGIKKDELLKFLKAIRVGLATRQALQLFDYKATAAAFRTQKIRRAYQRLHEDAFQGINATEHMEDLAYSGDEIAGWTATLTGLLEATPVASFDPNNEEWRKTLAKIRQRPRPFAGPDGVTYRYDRRKDCYWTTAQTATGIERRWAPFDHAMNTGRYVKFSPVDGRWYSHHPAYAVTPREIGVNSKQPEKPGDQAAARTVAEPHDGD